MPSATLPDSPTPHAAIRLLLLALLPLFAGILYLEGQSQPPDRIRLEPGNQAAATAAYFPATVSDLEGFGEYRYYNKENLSEYINGHAEYFISSGFQGLSVAEYAPAKAEAPTLVVNLYDLGKPLHAFGVLMEEAAKQAEAVEIGSMGFVRGDSLAFIHGGFYAQLSRFTPDIDLPAAARAVEARLAEVVPEQSLQLAFPAVGETLARGFVKENYRGLAFFHNILERRFRWREDSHTMFLMYGTPEQLAATLEALSVFLDEDGIEYQRLEQDGQLVYRVLDPYEDEWFLLADPERLLGVYAPLDPELLHALRNPPATAKEEG